MPRKIRPKTPPPRTISIFDRVERQADGSTTINKTKYLDIYSPQIMAQICDAHEITDPDLSKSLWHCLEFNAVQYKDLVQRKQAIATPAEIRGELNELEKLANSLIGHFPLHPDIEYLRLKAEKDILPPPFSEDLASLAKFGAARSLGGANDWAMLSLADFLPRLELFRFHIKKMKEELRRGKDGPSFNTPLWGWVTGLATFWTNKLSRQFTVDTHKSDKAAPAEGTTKSYAFLKDCLSPLAPEQIDHLPSMMRRVRTDMNPPRKRDS